MTPILSGNEKLCVVALPSQSGKTQEEGREARRQLQAGRLPASLQDAWLYSGTLDTAV